MNYDYVIVGGGSAGSTLASRLSDDPSVTVCLIEAGGDGKDVLIRAPAGVALMLPGRPKINNWAFETVPQAGLNGRRGFQPRGKALGGSSAINAMLYTRGHRSDYDDWAALGCKGWSYADVLPYFLRAEANQNGADAWHGDSGPLQVSNQRNPRAITHAFIRAAGELQYRENADFNGPEQEGVGLYQVTQFHKPDKAGERCSAAAAYLHPVAGPRQPDHRDQGARDEDRIRGQAGEERPVPGRRSGENSRRRTARSFSAAGRSTRPSFCNCQASAGRTISGSTASRSCTNSNGVGQNLRDHLDFILVYKSKDTDLHRPRTGRDGQDGEGHSALAQGRLRPDCVPGGRRRRLPEDGPVPAETGHPASFRRVDRSTTTRASCISATDFPATSACCGRSRSARCSFRAPIRWRRRASTRGSCPTPRISACW